MRIDSLLRAAGLAVILGLLCASAHGQGLPMLSDPIDTDRLVEYADLLELSPDQRLGLEPIHDAYMARFARLRDGEIQDFQDTLLDVGMSFMRSQFRIPERKRLEEVIESYKSVLARITEVDRTLLGELEGLLTDEQRERMVRVRHLRELEVMGLIVLEMSGEMNEGARPNLSELLEKLELSPRELEAIAPARAAYEAALLARVRDLHEAFEEAAMFALDTVDEMGFREMTMLELAELGEDPEMIAQIQVRFDEGSKPVQVANHAIAELNLRTFRTLAPLLDPEAAEAFRHEYYRRAFPNAWPRRPAWRERYDRAGRIEGLAADVIESLRSTKAGYVRQDDQAVEALVEILHESRAYRTFGRLSGMEPNPEEAKRDELRERRATIAEQAEATLASLLGPEAYAAIDGVSGETDEEAAASAAAAAAKGGSKAGTGASATKEEERMPRVRGLPGPMPARARATLADRLELTADQQAVLKTLHQDYRAEWRSLLEGAREAGEDLDEDTTAAAWSALARLDDTLFEEIELTLTADDTAWALGPLRSARRATVLTSATRSLTRRGDDEGWVDLVTLALGSSLTNEDLEAIAGALDAYAQRLEPLLVERLDLARTARRRRATMERVRQSDKPGAEQLADSVEAKWAEARRATERKTGEIGALNRSALGDIASGLDDAAGRHLRFSYNREAHPDVYRGAVELEKMFDTALALPDLAPHQRDRIAEVATDFRERYDELAERSIRLRRARTPFTEMPTLAQIEREIALERLQFDTRELAARTRLRLELSLSAEQAEALPPRRPRRR
jgi:hypothetical protein